MKGLLIWLVISTGILTGIGYYGNDCTWPDLTPEEEVVVEDGYDELKALQDIFYNMKGSEIEEYLKANNIPHTAEDTSGFGDRYVCITKGDWQLQISYYKNFDSPNPFMTIGLTEYE